MAASSVTSVELSDSEFRYESDGERQDFDNLKEIFGDDRANDIRRQFLKYRQRSGSKKNRFNNIANALITATEEEEEEDGIVKNITEPKDFSPVTPKTDAGFQPSVKSKRLRSAEEETKSPTASLVRGDTELYDSVAEVDDQSTKLKKPKMFNNNSAHSDDILKFLSKLNDTHPNNGIDPNFLYNRLEASEEDFELECKKIMDEIGHKKLVVDTPPPITRKATSDSTRAAIINILINEEGLNVKNDVGEVGKHIKQIESLFRDTAPPWEVLFRRLATADNILAEEHRIIDEINAPGSSNAVAAASTNGGRLHHPSEEFLVEILSETEQNAMKQILDMFPDVDPHYILKNLAEKQVEPEHLVDKLSRGGYPKYKDRLENQRKEERRRQFLDPNSFDLDEFLRTFGHEPELYFTDTTKPVTELYRYHALAQLQNDFPKLAEAFLNVQLGLQNNHYYPTLRQIQELLLNPKGKTHRKINRIPQARKDYVPFPDSIDELFFRELQFVRNYDDIKDYLEAKNDSYKRRLEEARAKNELHDCLCCFADDVLPEEMLSCSEFAHSFCSACVRRHAEEVIAQGRHIVPCMDDGCENAFAFSTLRNLLQPRLMDLLLRRNQMAEIRQAGIENVASCPFCDFLLVMENDDDHVFSCRNPQCLRESCRLCKEPNHVPLKCNEVEKADETAMRTFIENRMANALIRNCPKCGQRIVKEDGCNKMKCPCGANMCYVCRKDIGHDGEAYNHFGHECTLHTSDAKVHGDPVASAGEQAKKEFLEAHPELKGRRDIELKKLMDDSSKKNDGDVDSDDEDFNDNLEDEFDYDSDADAGLFRRLHIPRPMNYPGIVRPMNFPVIARPIFPPIGRKFLPGANDSSDDDNIKDLLPAYPEPLDPLPLYREPDNQDMWDFRDKMKFGYDYLGFFQNDDVERRTVEDARRRVRISLIEAKARKRAAEGRSRENRKRQIEQQRALLLPQRLNEVQEGLATKLKNLFGDLSFQQHPINSTLEPYLHENEQSVCPLANDEDDLLEFRDPVDLIDFFNDGSAENQKIKEQINYPSLTEDRDGTQREFLQQIDQLRVQVNEAQIRLCEKQRTNIRGTEGLCSRADSEDYVEFGDRSLRNLMDDRDQLLIQLRNMEETALRQGIPEDQVYPREENILTNDDIERSIEEARKMIERQKTQTVRNRTIVGRKLVRPIFKPVKLNRDQDKVKRIINRLQEMLTLIRNHAIIDKILLIDYCQMTRQIALEYAPHLNVELSLTEILSEAECPLTIITNEMQERYADVLTLIIQYLKLRRSSHETALNIKPRYIKPVAQGGADANVQPFGNCFPKFESEAELKKRKAVLQTADDAFQAHDKETKRLRQQLENIQNELGVIREQRRILEGREADLNAIRRRLLDDIEERKPTEKQLKKRLNDLRKTDRETFINSIVNPSEKFKTPLLLETFDFTVPNVPQTVGKQTATYRDFCVTDHDFMRKLLDAKSDEIPRCKIQSQFFKIQSETETVLKRVQTRFDNYLQKTILSANKENRLRERLIDLSNSLRKTRRTLEQITFQQQNKYENSLDVGKQLDQIRREIDVFESHVFKTTNNKAPLIDFDEEENAISILFENVQPAIVTATVKESSDIEINNPNFNTKQPSATDFDMTATADTYWDLPGPSGWKSDQSNNCNKEIAAPSVKPKNSECCDSVPHGPNQSQQSMVQINVHLNSLENFVNGINLFEENHELTTNSSETDEIHPKDEIFWDTFE